MTDAALDSIADALGALGIHPISRHQELAQAGLVMKALNDAGFFICRMDGGVHQGTCPTCGCAPVSVGESADQEKSK